MRPTPNAHPSISIDELSAILSACGFNVRVWKGLRLYISGYGRDIKAYLCIGDEGGPLPADGCGLVVTSNWSAARYNGLRCKGVKHAILEDLYAARLISTPPPRRWQDVELDAPQAKRPVIRPFTPVGAPSEPPEPALPARHPRDPYEALRALHDRSGNA